MNFSRVAARARYRVRARVRAGVRGSTGRALKPSNAPDQRAGSLTPGEAATATASTAPVPPAAVVIPAPPATAAITHAEVRTIFFGLMLTAFLAALNQTIIATALPTIGRHFADFENLSWIVTAYLLTSTAVAPLYGKLADIHGRRAILLTAVGLLSTATLFVLPVLALPAMIFGLAVS